MAEAPLVTAADGYRTVLSGKELLAGAREVLLATNEDGQRLGERGTAPRRARMSPAAPLDACVRNGAVRGTNHRTCGANAAYTGTM
ncbi:MAG: hypothetical protein AB2L07_00390 [Thermoanaerobaculaceae bacterium]